MSLIDNLIKKALPVPAGREWPVGKGDVIGPEDSFGHDQSEFSPEEYGDYIATSNDIYSVVSARARMLSDLDMRFYRGRRADKTELPDDPAAQLYGYVNKFWTRRRLNRMHELCMGLWGHTAEAVEYDRGQPKEIWWIKPSRLKPVVHPERYIAGYLYHSLTGQIIPFEPNEINWYRYPNPIDEFSPLSPLAAARLAADTSSAMMASANQLFSNGMQAAGLVVPATDKVTFTKDQADDLELFLKRRLSGAKNRHRWAVMRYEAQFKQLQVTPKDAESIAGMNASFKQVCRAYGMPPPLLGDMDGATLSNVREFQKIAWELALGPDSRFFAEDVAEQYLKRFRRGGVDYCEYDYSQVPALQESESAVWLRDAQALDRGAITINEWRAAKGLPPVPWGDKPWMPVNKATVGPDGKLELPETDGSGNPPDDEKNPANQPDSPRALTHMAARDLLASFRYPIMNGVKL